MTVGTLELQTAKFGTIRYRPEDVIRVEGGIPGFHELQSFVLVENPEYEPIRFLQSVDNGLISFPLIDPRLVREDYQVVLSPEQQEALGLERAEDGLSYSILTLADRPEAVTANLFAPLVINTANMRAAQVILVQSRYSVAEPVLR